MAQINNLNRILKLYEERIQEVIKEFTIKFGHRNPIKKYRQGLINRTGFFDNTTMKEYSFHGSGCSVEFNNGEIVSFDFLENDDFTFDLFKFSVFVDSIQGESNTGIDSQIDNIELIKNSNGWEIGSVSK